MNAQAIIRGAVGHSFSQQYLCLCQALCRVLQKIKVEWTETKMGEALVMPNITVHSDSVKFCGRSVYLLAPLILPKPMRRALLALHYRRGNRGLEV